MLKNCRPEQVQPCSVDIRIESLHRIKAKDLIDISEGLPETEPIGLPYIIKPGEYVLASSIEIFDQDNTDYSAIVIPRTIAFRIGLAIENGMIYPYYKGRIVFGIQNVSDNPILLKKGMSLVQLAFFDVSSDIIPLQHRFKKGVPL